MAFKDWRKNYLCLIGATIGLVSIFLPWQTSWITGGSPVLDYLFRDLGYHDSSLLEIVTWRNSTNMILVFGVWIFTISSIAVFFSPIAGISQIIGLSMVGFYIVTVPQTLFLGITIGISLSTGFFIALIGAMLSIASLIRPIGQGYAKGLLFLGDRILTLNPLQRLYADFNLRINQVALIGMFIGIISLFASWFIAAAGSNGLNAMDVITTRNMDDTLVFATMLFLIGTIFSLMTPAALLLQLSGLTIFVADLTGFFIGLGVYLGFASAIILLVSMFRTSLMRPWTSKRLISRLLTFGLRIEMKCPACGNNINHVRDACSKCSQSSESSMTPGS